MTKPIILNRFCYGGNLTASQFKELRRVISIDQKTLSDLGIDQVQCYQSDQISLVLLDLSPDEKFEQRIDELNNSTVNNLQLKFLADLTQEGHLKKMNRIFKMDLLDKGDLPEGKYRKITVDYQRYVTQLKIKPEASLLSEYIKSHSKELFWTEIIENMKTMKVMDMEIYHHDYQMFLLMDTDPHFDLDKDGDRWSQLPREQEWQTKMAKFQKADLNSKALEKWQLMTQMG